jgi:hypothetical protein
MEAETLNGLRRRIHRTWWAFRIGYWGLLGVCGALILAGLFVPGVLAGLASAGLNVAWRDWARRVEERYPAQGS